MKKRKEILGDRKEEALFISNQKCRMEQTSIYRVVNKYAKGINGKHITSKVTISYKNEL